MAGHGSPPAENKANHPGRKVDRASASSAGWQGGMSTQEVNTAAAAKARGGWYRDESGALRGKVSGPGPNG